MQEQVLDVAIVGGGPGGLSAALVLGRALRTVVVLDHGQPRNGVSHAVHGFFTRDGTPPGELRRIGREQLAPYEQVRFERAHVTAAKREHGLFVLLTADGRHFRARKLILATGLIDQLPEVAGMSELYGRSVFSCPYCDGWERRGQPLAIYGGDDAHGAELALELTCWSRDLVLCTDGRSTLSRESRERLARNEIAIREEPIAYLAQREGRLSEIVFASGPPLPRSALFLHGNYRQASDLARQLGAEGWSPHDCQVQKHGRAGVPGLFVVGDASRDVLQVAVAVGEGCETAITVNSELLRESLR